MIIGGFPGFDTASASASLLRTQLADLTRQVASGRKADSYAGLGPEARRAIDLRADRARQEVLATASARGAAFAEAAQGALKGISDAVLRVMERAGRLVANGLPASDGQTVAQTAQDARATLREVVGLLGERFAGEAIFGGADSEGRPIVAPEAFEDTGLFRQIGAAVRNLSPSNGQAVLDETMALAKSDDPAITPFTGFAARAAQGLSADARRAVPVGEGATVEIGLYAYRNAAVASRGETTGAWARDLIRGLSIIASLGPDQAAQGAGYTMLVSGAAAALRAGFDGLAEEQGALGGQQARLEAAARRNDALATQIDLQLGALEQVDMAEAITRLQATQGQLAASYRALAMLGDLSLLNFIR